MIFTLLIAATTATADLPPMPAETPSTNAVRRVHRRPSPIPAWVLERRRQALSKTNEVSVVIGGGK